MRKLTFPLLVLVCFTQLLAAQNQKLIFSDDFSSNKNNWPTYTTSNINYLVYNGKYVLDAEDSATYNIFIPVKIDTTKNYTISVTTLHTTGNVNSGYGLYFGGADHKNYYSFCLTANGYYRLDKTMAGNYSTLVPWTTSVLIKQGNYAENEIKIIRDGIYWKLMINGQLVNTIPRDSLLGDKMGFTKNYPQRIEFDNLKVTQN